jgi:hypothetical protein
MLQNVQYGVCLFPILAWCDLFAVVMCMACLCLHAYVCYCLLALDSNDTECTEKEEVFDYQGEDQGQADQGKPSKLVSYLIPILLIA